MRLIIHYLTHIIAVANLAIGLIVLLKARDVKVRVFFFLMSTFTTLWVLGSWYAHYLKTEYFAFVSGKVAFVAAPFIALFFIFLITEFPREIRLSGITKVMLILYSLFLSIFGVTPYVEQKIIILSQSLYNNSIYGKLDIFYELSIVFLFAIGFYYFGVQLRNSKGIKKLKLKFTLLGFALAASVGVFTNALWPMFVPSNTGALAPYGPLFTIFFVVSTAYSIIRYRFLDVRLIIRRGIVHTLAFGILAGSLSLLTIGVWKAALAHSPENQLTAIVVSLFVIALTFEPLRRYVIRWTNRVFFAKEYERRRVARNFRDVPPGVSLEDFANRLSQNASTYVDGASCRLLLRSGNAWKDTADQPAELNISLTQLVDLNHGADLIVRDEIEFLLDGASPERRQILTDLRQAMEQSGTGVLALIRGFNDEIIGLIVVGPKQSKEAFTVEDIRFLKNVVKAAGVVLANIQMYQNIIRQLRAKASY